MKKEFNLKKKGEKFNLKKKRQELFDIMINERPTKGRIYRLVRKQDKEFIKLIKKVSRGKDGFHTEAIHKRIDKLAGDT